MIIKSLNTILTGLNSKEILNKSKRNEIPGITGLIMKIENEQEFIPELDKIINESTMYLVKFGRDKYGKDLYIVIKNNEDLPHKNEVVTEDFIRFLENTYGIESVCEKRKDSLKMRHAIEGLNSRWLALTAGRYLLG